MVKTFIIASNFGFCYHSNVLFYILIVRLSKCIKDRKKFQYEMAVLFLLFAYFIVQGFWPDLGTAIRHIGVFPLIYYALYYRKFLKRITILLSPHCFY
jgi:hypothetical protein